MKKSFLSVVIAISLIVTCFVPSVGAANKFTDVDSQTLKWAATEINEMAELGFIKGYSDGTFKPNKSINKMEAMLLFARVAGFSNIAYEKIVEQAYEQYMYLLDEIKLGSFEGSKKEIAFLINRGIISEDEVVEYLGDGAYKDEFPRKDAAVFLTKLSGETAKKGTYTFDFVDEDEIEDSVKGYIAYVVESGLMAGVQNNDGTVSFEAENPMTRAQVSVILYRVLDKVQISAEAGAVERIDLDGSVVDFINGDNEVKNYIVPEEAKITINGEEAELEDVLNESHVVFTRNGKEIKTVDFISPKSNVTVKGTVDEIKIQEKYTRVSVKLDETEEIKKYYITENVEVTSNGVKDKISAVKKDDYVVIKLLGTTIVSIDRQETKATVQGTLEAVSITDPVEITVLTLDETTDEEISAVYSVADNAVIRRDGEKALLSNISVGDKVVLALSRGVVTKLTATSTKGSATGTITSILIAPQSKVVMVVNSVEKEYPIAMDATYTVAGKEGTIYDLRLGNVISVTLSGSTITKIEQATETTSSTKTGIVESISSSYGYVQIISTGATGSVTEQIFASKAGSSLNVKVINGETGAQMNFKDIKKNDTIIAVGAYSNGAFVAKTIIVTPN
ncbi:MAG: S-layer homology domain-containing protein [Clostridia bacterium]|nr:S-layer homology domain-containing protein [Clostridia bacterium]